MDSPVEGRYRWLLLAYPARYRAERGEEILATLLEAADSSRRRRPTVQEAVDLLGSGLVSRLGFGHVPGLAAGAAIAAPVALALAGGLGVFEWALALAARTRPELFDRFALPWLIWPAVALAAAAVPRIGRLLVGAAVVLAMLLAYRNFGTYNSYRWAGVYILPVACGLVAAFGWSRDASRAHRLIAALGVPAVLAAAMALGSRLPFDGWQPQSLPTPVGRLSGELLHPMAQTAVGFAVLAGAAMIAVLRHRESRWIWAAVLLAVPAGGLARMLVEALHARDTTPMPSYSELVVSVPAFAAGALAAIWLAGQTRVRVGDDGAGIAERGLGIVAAAALAGGAGLSAAWWLIELRILRDRDPNFPYGVFEPIPVSGRIAFAAWIVAAVGYAVTGARLGRWLTWIALGCTVAAPLVDDGMARGSEVPPLIILATLALLSMPAKPSRAQRIGVVVAAVGLALAAVAVVVAQDDDSDRYAQLAAWIGALASVPYAVAVAAATLAVRARGPRRLAAASALVVATVALSAVLLSFTAHVMAVGLASVAALVGLGAAVARRLRRTARTPRAG